MAQEPLTAGASDDTFARVVDAMREPVLRTTTHQYLGLARFCAQAGVA